MVTDTAKLAKEIANSGTSMFQTNQKTVAFSGVIDVDADADAEMSEASSAPDLGGI